MNLTAANGILIVALFFALGLHWNDKVLIFLAFAMAGVSYILNIIDEQQIATGRNLLFWVAFAMGLAAYGYGFLKLIGAY